MCLSGLCPTLEGSSGDAALLAIDATNVYWTDYGGEVLKAPLSGGTPSTLATGQGYINGFAIDSSNAYWTTWSTDTVVERRRRSTRASVP
jgi:hypothetical protein